MPFKELQQKPSVYSNPKVERTYNMLRNYLSELKLKEVPDDVVSIINTDIDEINSSDFSDGKLKRLINKKRTKITSLVEKQLKIVPKNYYRTIWTSVGIGAFGLPFGVAFGSIFGNMAFLGIGLPFGLAIGLALGSSMDKKAEAEGRQLNCDMY